MNLYCKASQIYIKKASKHKTHIELQIDMTREETLHDIL